MKKEIQERKKFQKIRIVSSDYKITYHEFIVEDGHSLDGHIDEGYKEIKVLDSLDYQYELQVILHEAIHGMGYEMRFDLENNERMTCQLTTCFSCFIRDNPEFIMEYMRVLNK